MEEEKAEEINRFLLQVAPFFSQYERRYPPGLSPTA
jgi:hypothetical protein